jgi:hypothetical protein
MQKKKQSNKRAAVFIYEFINLMMAIQAKTCTFRTIIKRDKRLEVSLPYMDGVA